MKNKKIKSESETLFLLNKEKHVFFVTCKISKKERITQKKCKITKIQKTCFYRTN